MRLCFQTTDLFTGALRPSHQQSKKLRSSEQALIEYLARLQLSIEIYGLTPMSPRVAIRGFEAKSQLFESFLYLKFIKNFDNFSKKNVLQRYAKSN